MRTSPPRPLSRSARPPWPGHSRRPTPPHGRPPTTSRRRPRSSIWSWSSRRTRRSTTTSAPIPQAANPPGDPPFEARANTPTVNNLLPSPLNGNRDLRATNPNQSKPFRLDRTQFVTCSQDHTYRPEQRAANLGRMNRFVQPTDNSDVCAPAAARAVTAGHGLLRRQHGDGAVELRPALRPQRQRVRRRRTGRRHPAPSTSSPDARPGPPRTTTKTVTQGVLYGDADPSTTICSDPAKGQATLTGPNVGDLLTQAGVSWGWFQGGFRLDPATTRRRRANGTIGTSRASRRRTTRRTTTRSSTSTRPPTRDTCRRRRTRRSGMTTRRNHQYDLGDFWTAADSGHLPAVSYLKAAGYQDGHPGPQNSNPLDEQDFLVSTLNHLQRLPEWSSHRGGARLGRLGRAVRPRVPAQRAPLGQRALDRSLRRRHCETPSAVPGSARRARARPGDRVFEMRCGYGERLPLLVVSPYAQDNHVDHTLIDQTSVLQFIEDNWGLGRLGHESFDAEAGSLLEHVRLQPTAGRPAHPQPLHRQPEPATVDRARPR